MKWYYAEDKKPIGPLDDDAFRSGIENGTIGPKTLVWRSGMDEWKPLFEIDLDFDAAPIPEKPVTKKEIREKAVETSAQPVSEKEAEAIAAGTKPDEDNRTVTVPCAECGRYFPMDSMGNVEGSWVCESCEPDAREKQTRNEPLADQMNYAGFWVRAGAKILDVIILWIIGAGLSLVLKGILDPSSEGDSAMQFAIALNLIQLGAAVTYTTYFIGKFSATPGKMACNLKVVSPEGGKISYRRACGRYFAEIVSSLLFCIGYIIAAFDKQRRTLHDRIVRTRVILV